MIKMIARDASGEWILTLILDYENLDRLLKNKPIRWTGKDITLTGRLERVLFVLFFNTPGAESLVADLRDGGKKLLAENPAGVCAIMLPLEYEAELRAGHFIECRKEIGRLKLKIMISATPDLEGTEKAILKSGMIGPETVVRKEGFHPEKKLEGMN